ncbi:MAG TPA: hypothetical protein VID50_07215 [Candidatus Eisenbacteria bacterium]|jgi:hypothetical protein
MSPARAILVALVIAAVAAGGFFYQRAQELAHRFEVEKRRGDELQSQVLQWQSMAYNVWLKQEAGQAVNDSLLARTSFLEQLELDELERKGLHDPVMSLKSDLMSHPELIPYEGTMGGTMRFPRPATIILLPGGYAHARFEDGHLSGECLLEFSVQPNGAIEWKRIAARLD